MKAQDITAADIAEALKQIEMEEKMFGQIGSGQTDLIRAVRDSSELGISALLQFALLSIMVPGIVDNMKKTKPTERPWDVLMTDNTIPEHMAKLIQLGMALAKMEKEEKVTA